MRNGRCDEDNRSFSYYANAHTTTPNGNSYFRGNSFKKKLSLLHQNYVMCRTSNALTCGA